MRGGRSLGSIALAGALSIGYLMPTRKDQPAPDLKAFDQSRQ